MTYPLTKEECEKIGGHCYEMDDLVIATNPPIHTRTCKHCGHKQTGRLQPEIDWGDL